MDGLVDMTDMLEHMLEDRHRVEPGMVKLLEARTVDL